jgi:hypothetical protein
VDADGLDADAELVGDLAVREALGGEGGDL